MSEQSKVTRNQGMRKIPSELPARRDMAGVDCTGLARAIELSASGSLQGDALVALLRHELANVQRQAQTVTDLLQKSAVDLRQLRESAQREQVQKQDEQRQLQDQNDRFVANLIHEQEVELMALRRERDAAIDRIRELSRGITRVGSTSSGSLSRVSVTAASSTPTAQEVLELKARVEELLYERERSLRLLRQLAEQRDHAESRLQAAHSPMGPGGTTGAELGPERTPLTGVGLTHDRLQCRQAPAAHQPEVVHGTAQALSASDSPVRVPTLPSKATSSGAEMGILENPNGWDIGESENLPTGEGPGSAGNRRDAITDPPAPEVPRAIGRLDRAGAYSMHADELTTEEVFVSRGPRNAPKST
jgi:hypothetical protein